MNPRGGMNNYNNNHNKKRPRNNSGWGPYYIHQRQNRIDRHAELDSSTATAINASPKPTLGNRRRQLADDSHLSCAKRHQYANEICKDLLSKHPEETIFSQQRTPSPESYANPRLLKSREKFWKRQLLSNLSTKEYDSVWREGRNKFLQGQICRYCNYVQTHHQHHHGQNNHHAKSALHLLQHYSIQDSWKQHLLFPKQHFPEMTTEEFEHVWKVGRNEYLGERIYWDLKTTSHGGGNDENANAKSHVHANPMLIGSKKAEWKTELLPKLSQEDFDDAWKQGRNAFFKELHGHHDSKTNTATGGTTTTTRTTTTTEAMTSTTTTTKNNTMDEDHDAKSMEGGQRQNASSNENQSSIPSDNHEVIDLCDSDSEEEETETTSHRRVVQSSEQMQNLPRAKQEENTTSTAEEEEAPSPNDGVFSPAAVPTETSGKPCSNTKTPPPTNRWSKLFLGPDFRTEFVFSLDEECF